MKRRSLRIANRARARALRMYERGGAQSALKFIGNIYNGKSGVFLDVSVGVAATFQRHTTPAVKEGALGWKLSICPT